jgi:hypothetical protein
MSQLSSALSPSTDVGLANPKTLRGSNVMENLTNDRFAPRADVPEESVFEPKDRVIGRLSLWIAEDFGVLRFKADGETRSVVTASSIRRRSAWRELGGGAIHWWLANLPCD